MRPIAKLLRKKAVLRMKWEPMGNKKAWNST